MLISVAVLRTYDMPGNNIQVDHDETGFLPSQQDWNIKDRDNWGPIANGILYQINPPKRRLQAAPAQRMFEDGKLVLDYNNESVSVL